MRIVDVAITLCGVRPEPRNSLLKFVNRIIEPLLEAIAISFCCKAIIFKGSYLTQSCALTFNATSITAALFIRKWVRKNKSLLQESQADERQLGIGAAFDVLSWGCLIVNQIRNRHNWRSSFGVVGYSSMLAVVHLRLMAAMFLMRHYIYDVNLRIQQKPEGRTPPNTDLNLQAYEKSCRVLADFNEKLDGIHDWCLGSIFLRMSLVDSLAIMSSCDHYVHVGLDIIIYLMPMFRLIAAANRIAKIMQSSRRQLRNVWLKQSVTHQVHAALGHAFGQGVRCCASYSVMDSRSALSFLSNVVCYGTLIITTPLFERENLFNLFC